MGENRKIHVRYNKFTDLLLESVAVDLAEINKNTYIPVIFKAVHTYGFFKDKSMYAVKTITMIFLIRAPRYFLLTFTFFKYTSYDVL